MKQCVVLHSLYHQVLCVQGPNPGGPVLRQLHGGYRYRGQGAEGALQEPRLQLQADDLPS